MKAEPGPLYACGDRTGEAPKWLKQLWEIVLGDSDTVIGDIDHHPAGLLANGDGDVSVVGRILHRVGYEVAQDRLDLLGVRAQADPSGRLDADHPLCPTTTRDVC